jgi:cytochrome P450
VLAENFDHVSPAFHGMRRDFYAHIHASGCPVRRSSNHGGFTYVARYETALAIQRNPELFSNKRFTIPERPVPPLIPATLDPPEHAEYKKMLSTFFTPATAARLGPRLATIANSLISVGVAAGKFDLVQDVMFPLMAEFTMGDVLGLEVSKAFTYAEPIHNMTRRDYPSHKAEEELNWLGEQLKSDIREKRIDPEGILGQLTRVDFGGRLLTEEELRLIATNLLIGGMGTTSYFMGSVAVFLARNLSHRQQLIDNPALIPGAIEELLRIFTPTQNFGRSVTTDTELEGCPIKAGEKVLIGYGAANFDPDVFPEPQKVDFERSPNRHMSFGIGAHRCLGSHIAREVSRSVTHTLLQMVPNYSLVDEEVIEQTPAASMFGFNHVPIIP